MVGVPRSGRCLTCAKRKVKCDEAWPTCGACKRSKKVCPGPPSSKLKFVHNGHHTIATYGEEEDAAADTTQAGDQASNAMTNTQSLGGLVETKLTKAEDGRSFRRLRLKPAHPSPRLVRLGDGDRSAAQLISVIRACPDTGFDVCLGSGLDSLHMMGRCMSHNSPVLQDAVGAMVASWTNLRRGLRHEHVLDAPSYFKAISSINEALNKESKEGKISLETYAAVGILTRVEFNYDLLAVTNSNKHSAGLATIMIMRGPPQSHDTIDLLLGLQNFMVLAMDLARKGNGLEELNRWKEALKQSVKIGGIGPRTGFLVRLLFQAAEWPCIVNLKGALRQMVRDCPPQKTAEIVGEVLGRLKASITELRALDAEMILPDMRNGNIRLVSSPPTGRDGGAPGGHPSPLRKHYQFGGWNLSAIFRLHAFCLVAMNRMLNDVHDIMGRDTASFERKANDDEARRFSRRIWLSHEHAMRHWPLGSTQTMANMILAYEAGDAVERAYVLQGLRDLNRHRTPAGASVDDFWTEATVLYAGRQVTGRNPI
ncbi:cysteine-binding protein FliY [Apiospora sp. TS-2023a]